MRLFAASSLVIALPAAMLVLASGGQPAASPPDFARAVLPILTAKCAPCHGKTVQQSGLDLSSIEAMRKGGSHGSALTPGKPDASPLYTRAADRSMPPGPVKLTKAELETLRAWIAAGAPGKPEAAAAKAIHWAFEPPRKPAQPQVKATWWVRNPIDAFVLARMEANGIAPPRTADRLTLLRRLTLDLTGLPPTPEEQRRFLADTRPDAYERLVDDLLSRPQYGERWARHWLDVARYAESNGYERDSTKASAWRYRDYVIGSLNQDKPFDRFLLEQIAGDELPNSTAEQQIATTFLRLGTWDDEPADALQDRYDQLDDVVGTTSAAFLGVTLRCARCHDHKFEPFTTRDYYRVLAAFHPLKRPEADRDVLAGTESELRRYTEAMERWNAEHGAVVSSKQAYHAAIRERLFESGSSRLAAEVIAAFRTPADKRTEAQKQLVAQREKDLLQEVLGAATEAERAALDALDRTLAQMEERKPQEPPRAYIWQEETKSAPRTAVLLRGDPRTPSEEVRMDVPATLRFADLEEPAPTSRSTGRRLALARWMARPDNPLTARVFVNRVWQGHFGRGIVATPNDFGIMGERPTHPELLDWLAVHFAAPRRAEAGTPSSAGLGWSMKALHRLIVTSNTYKAASEWRAEAAKKDPENKTYWRFQPRRLEAEAIRDSMLAASGRLNKQVGGPPFYPTLPREVLAGQSRPGDGWGTSSEEEQGRRSIYIHVKRSLAVPELEALDAPDTTTSCEARPTSTVAPQALTFLNGAFANQMAAAMAGRIRQEGGDTEESRLDHAFRIALGRPARKAEITLGTQFLRDHTAQIATELRQAGASAEPAADRAWQALCLVLLNTNEFFYIP
jgi:hypothetical protein